MKRLLYLILALCGAHTMLFAQTPTYSEDIAPIIFDNCATCHHEGGIAPFSLMNYTETQARAFSIQSSVNSGEMPPWPPNPDYQNYAHERLLEQSEVDMINDWVNNGTPEGNPANLPPAPVFGNGTFITEAPDLKLTIPTYSSNATGGQDDYVCFSLPTGLLNDRFVKAIEVVPGNPEIVHHVLVYADNAGNYQTDTSGICGGPTTGLIAGYAPGEFPTVYPNGGTVNMGVRLEAGSNVVLAMHYPEGSFGMIDSTSIHIYFHDPAITNIREVSAAAPLNDWNFCIDANTVETISKDFTVPFDASILSVFPHSHLLGQDFLVYGVTPQNDTIPIIDIPKWDFEWQGFYLFENIMKIPAGTRLEAIATYDNTTNNPYNPNNPPQDICAGLNTSDEMFLIYFQYLPYLAGDEFIDLEALTTFNTPTGIQQPNLYNPNLLKAYPNPFKDEIQLEYALSEADEVALEIFNMQGQQIRDFGTEYQASGFHQYTWDGTDNSGNRLPTGVYWVRMRVGDTWQSQQVLLQR